MRRKWSSGNARCFVFASSSCCSIVSRGEAATRPRLVSLHLHSSVDLHLKSRTDSPWNHKKLAQVLISRCRRARAFIFPRTGDNLARGSSTNCAIALFPSLINWDENRKLMELPSQSSSPRKREEFFHQSYHARFGAVLAITSRAGAKDNSVRGEGTRWFMSFDAFWFLFQNIINSRLTLGWKARKMSQLNLKSRGLDHSLHLNRSTVDELDCDEGEIWRCQRWARDN